MKTKKSQVAIEFMLIFGLILSILIGFLYLLNTQITEIGEKEDLVEINNLGNVLRNEVLLARQVYSGYLRKFDIPPEINGKHYSIKLLQKSDADKITKHSIQIKLDDHEEEHNFALPLDIHGEFVDVKPEHLSYCLTKPRNTDQITISKNRIGFSYACDDANPLTNCPDLSLTSEGLLDVPSGYQFSLYLDAFCVNNLQYLEILVYHPGFTFIKARKAHLESGTRPDVTSAVSTNMYGDDMFEGDKPETKAILTIENPNTNADITDSDGDGTITVLSTKLILGHLGPNGPQGSDALVELVFQADNSKKVSCGTGYTDPCPCDSGICNIWIDKDEKKFKYQDATLSFEPGDYDAPSTTPTEVKIT